MKLQQYIFHKPVEFDRVVIPGVFVDRDGVTAIELTGGVLTVSRQDGVWFVLDGNGVGVPEKAEKPTAPILEPPVMGSGLAQYEQSRGKRRK